MNTLKKTVKNQIFKFRKTIKNAQTRIFNLENSLTMKTSSIDRKYQQILNVIIIFIKLYILTFETCSQSHSVVIKINKFKKDLSYYFANDLLMKKGVIIPQSHTLPYTHNNYGKNKRLLKIKNLLLNNNVFYQCKLKDHFISCTMLKKYAKYYIFTCDKEKEYDTSIHSKFLFFKLETSYTYSYTHIKNADKTYDKHALNYKDCNIDNTDTIERIENCVSDLNDQPDEDNDDADETHLQKETNPNTINEKIGGIVKKCTNIDNDPLYVEIEDDVYLQKINNSSTRSLKKGSANSRTSASKHSASMSPGSTHSKKSSISNKSVNGKNTNSRQYIHNEILSYNLHNRVGTEFYVPSNLYRFIFDFSTSEYCENIYRQIDDFTNSLSSQTEIMTSIIELIKSNILILLNKIYGLTQNRIDIFTQKINEILQDTIWLEKIRDIYIHCYIQRNIFIKYTINYDQHTKTVKIKPNIDLQDADFTKSSYTYSIQNESFNIGRYKNLEIPEVVISNIIFKMLQNDTHNMDFLQEQHFSNFEEKDIYLFKLKNVFIDTYKTNIVPQPFIIDYRLFNQQIDDFRRLQPRHGRVFFHKFSDSSLRQSQKSRSKYSANRS